MIQPIRDSFFYVIAATVITIAATVIATATITYAVVDNLLVRALREDVEREKHKVAELTDQLSHLTTQNQQLAQQPRPMESRSTFVYAEHIASLQAEKEQLIQELQRAQELVAASEKKFNDCNAEKRALAPVSTGVTPPEGRIKLAPMQTKAASTQDDEGTKQAVKAHDLTITLKHVEILADTIEVELEVKSEHPGIRIVVVYSGKRTALKDKNGRLYYAQKVIANGQKSDKRYLLIRLHDQKSASVKWIFPKRPEVNNWKKLEVNFKVNQEGRTEPFLVEFDNPSVKNN